MTTQNKLADALLAAKYPHIPCAKYDDLLDFHFAVGGEGPLAYEWSDKPHRLVFRLTTELSELRDSIAAIAAAPQPASEECFCDRMYPDSNPNASCGDCPTRDYAPKPAPGQWQPFETAPKDNERPLMLARFNESGQLTEFDYNGSWESESESWEIPQVYYYWASENGNVEEPTHWMYQPDWFATITPQPAPAPAADGAGELDEADDGYVPPPEGFELLLRTYELAAHEHGKTGKNAIAVDAAGSKLHAAIAALRQPVPDAVREDVLIRQLRGRAAFLRNRGRVKSPALMEEAASRLESAIASQQESRNG